MKMYMLTIVFLLYSCAQGIGNKKEDFNNIPVDTLVYFDSIINDYVYLSADKLPFYPGGDMMFINDIINNLGKIDQREYQEKVDIAFVVDCNGFIVGERIIGKKESDCTPIEKQALTSIRKLKDKKWIPAEYKGKRVSILMKPPLLIKYRN